MAMGINNVYSNYAGGYVDLIGTKQKAERAVGKDTASKPVWNGNKAYTYLEDLNKAGLEYGTQATKYYASKTTEDGAMSVEDLKKQIKEWFPDYTLTNSEPSKVVKGKHYLYIDDSQLKKMASDSSYRAKVYGLMDRELETGKSYTLTYSDGRKVTSHVTGSIFSLSENNRKYDCGDGIPYRGSCDTDAGWSSSESHIQVRNQSYLSDNLNPAKSAAKSRKTSVTKLLSEKIKKQRAEKKQAQKKLEEKRRVKQEQKEALEEKRQAKNEKEAELKEQLEKTGKELHNKNMVGIKLDMKL